MAGREDDEDEGSVEHRHFKAFAVVETDSGDTVEQPVCEILPHVEPHEYESFVFERAKKKGLQDGTYYLRPVEPGRRRLIRDVEPMILTLTGLPKNPEADPVASAEEDANRRRADAQKRLRLAQIARDERRLQRQAERLESDEEDDEDEPPRRGRKKKGSRRQDEDEDDDSPVGRLCKLIEADMAARSQPKSRSEQLLEELLVVVKGGTNQRSESEKFAEIMRPVLEGISKSVDAVGKQSNDVVNKLLASTEQTRKELNEARLDASRKEIEGLRQTIVETKNSIEAKGRENPKDPAIQSIVNSSVAALGTMMGAMNDALKAQVETAKIIREAKADAGVTGEREGGENEGGYRVLEKAIDGLAPIAIEAMKGSRYKDARRIWEIRAKTGKLPAGKKTKQIQGPKSNGKPAPQQANKSEGAIRMAIYRSVLKKDPEKTRDGLIMLANAIDGEMPPGEVIESIVAGAQEATGDGEKTRFWLDKLVRVAIGRLGFDRFMADAIPFLSEAEDKDAITILKSSKAKLWWKGAVPAMLAFNEAWAEWQETQSGDGSGGDEGGDGEEGGEDGSDEAGGTEGEEGSTEPEVEEEPATP